MESLQESLQTALEHHEAGALEPAERLYHEILRIDPRHGDALHLLGVVALQRKQHIAAIDYIGQAIDGNADCAVFHSNLGACYSALGQYDRAVQSLRRAIDLDPGLAAAHNHLGTALALHGKHNEAAAALEEALRVDPKQPDTILHLAHIFLALNRTPEAIERLQRLAETSPDAAGVHFELAEAYRQTGRQHEAIDAYRSALQLNPEFAEAYNSLGATLASFEETSGASACFQKAIEKRPDYLEAHCNLIAVHQHIGSIDTAIRCCRQALSACPDNLDLRCELASTLQQAERPDDAASLLEEVLQAAPEHLVACFSLADLRLAGQRLDEAAALYEKALALDPCRAGRQNDGFCLQLQDSQPREKQAPITACERNRLSGGWSNLGSIRAALGNTAAAIDCFRRAIELQPDDARLHYNLGNGLAELSRTDEAIESYRRALEINPDFAEAYNNLGTSLLNRGDVDEAESCFERAIRCDPEHASAHVNLGQALKHLGRLEESVAAYRRSIELAPQNGKAHFALAKVLEQLGEPDEAVKSYETSLELDRTNVRALLYLGNLLKEKGDNDRAVRTYLRALELAPDDTTVRNQLGNAYRDMRKTAAAVGCFKQILEQKPDDPSALIALGNTLREQDNLAAAAASYRKLVSLVEPNPLWDLWIATLCPTVFFGTVGIDDFRDRLNNDLKRIARMKVQIDPKEIRSRGCPPPYELQFHGRNDRPLKEAYARVFQDGLDNEPPQPGSGKPRIGIVVTNGHEGVLLRYMKHVLQRINADLFELEIVCSRAGAARIRKEMACESVRLREIPSRFDRAVEAIRDARFDLLYYWEIGSDVTNYFLPFFRLAPVQCTAGGLPVTSGIPQVDYFLSSEIAEPDDAQNHYSEKLISARSLLTYQTRMTPPTATKSRDEFGFKPRQHLYVCPHKIEKFHPDIDPLLAGILSKDSDGIIVIPEDPDGHAARKLKQRFTITLADVLNRVVFLPYQPFEHYLCLTAVADVLLDPVHYGGGLTAYDGFSFNQPIVTLPGEFVRGRYPYAFYRKMEIDDCVASSQEEYVDIAVSLGTDADYRAHVVEKISERSDVLFEDNEAVREHERIFQELVEVARTGGKDRQSGMYPRPQVSFAGPQRNADDR